MKAGYTSCVVFRQYDQHEIGVHIPELTMERHNSSICVTWTGNSLLLLKSIQPEPLQYSESESGRWFPASCRVYPGTQKLQVLR
jgi:hypothetical protein